MNLNPYVSPDFKLVEVRCEHRYCGVEVSARGAHVGFNEDDDSEVDEFDAAAYRGLWDEDEYADNSSGGIW